MLPDLYKFQYFFIFIIIYILWNIFGFVTYFDNFLIHQDLKFLKN
jgi:hypothetical protein